MKGPLQTTAINTATHNVITKAVTMFSYRLASTQNDTVSNLVGYFLRALSLTFSFLIPIIQSIMRTPLMFS